jgi:hypothetical protein
MAEIVGSVSSEERHAVSIQIYKTSTYQGLHNFITKMFYMQQRISYWKDFPIIHGRGKGNFVDMGTFEQD